MLLFDLLPFFPHLLSLLYLTLFSTSIATPSLSPFCSPVPALLPAANLLPDVVQL